MDYEVNRIYGKILNERKKYLNEIINSSIGVEAVQALREMRRYKLKLDHIPENILFKGTETAIIEVMKNMIQSNLSLPRDIFQNLISRDGKIKAFLIQFSEYLCPWLREDDLKSNLNDPSPDIRASALIRLKRILSVDELEHFLKDRNGAVRETAMIILSERVESPEYLKGILKLRMKRKTARIIVENFSKKGGRIDELLSNDYPKNVRIVSAAFLKDKDCQILMEKFEEFKNEMEVARRIMNIIGLKCGKEDAEMLKQRFMHILKKGKDELKVEVMRMFKRLNIKDKDLRNILLDLLKSAKNPALISEVIRYISKHFERDDFSNDTIEMISNFVKHSNKKVRKSAILFIKKMNFTGMLDEIEKMIKDRLEPIDVRKAALKSLTIDMNKLENMLEEIIISPKYPLDLKDIAFKLMIKYSPDRLSEMVM